MSSTEEEVTETRDRRLIREAKEEAYHARRKLRREQPNPSGETKQLLCAALADYRDVLWDYHDERALETDWGERDVDIDALDTILSATVTTTEELPRRGGPIEEVEVPAARVADTAELMQIAKELDAIAKELGFSASAKQPTPSEEADMDDLKWLLKARGQSQSLENLPGSDSDE